MLASVNGLFRLTRDLELRYLDNGTALGKLGLVCSEKFKEKETTLFIDAVVFGKQAEIINQWAGKKGTQIYLKGKLQTEQWEQEGVKRSKISMTIEGFDFVSNKQEAQNNQSNSHDNHNVNNSQPQQPQGQQSFAQPNPAEVPQYDIDEDEVPF